jgi:hypothetical protein
MNKIVNSWILLILLTIILNLFLIKISIITAMLSFILSIFIIILAKRNSTLSVVHISTFVVSIIFIAYLIWRIYA